MQKIKQNMYLKIFILLLSLSFIKIDAAIDLKTIGISALLAGTILPRIRYNIPQKPRYDVNLLQKPQETDAKTYLKNCWYLLSDGLIGHVGKKNNQDWKIKPMGICGNIASKIPPMIVASLCGVYGFFNWFNWKTIPSSTTANSENQNLSKISEQPSINSELTLSSAIHDQNMIKKMQPIKTTQLTIIPCKVNQQKDGYTCGDHVVCNAYAISQIAQEQNHIDHQDINKKHFEIFEQNCPYQNRSENKYLNGQHIYDFADKLHLTNIFVFNTNTMHYLKEQKGNNQLIARNSLNRLFNDIKNQKRLGAFHFIYNQNSIHWVLFSVIVRKDQEMLIFFSDSFNNPIAYDHGTHQFSQKLLQSIAEGHSCL